MRLLPRHIAIVALAALVLAGCAGGANGDSAETSSRAAGESAEAGSGADVDADEADATSEGGIAPARANAIGRHLDALVAAYAPVTGRVNFLVSAETLREDAVDSGAGGPVELERTGAVRVELRRLRNVLAAARPDVVDVAVDNAAQQRVQRQMLRAIDARERALGELEFALDGLAGEVGDTVVEQRFDAWRASWDESLRAAREATTTMQDERARVGLAPAPEESIR